jgi:hypothetical protein
MTATTPQTLKTISPVALQLRRISLYFSLSQGGRGGIKQSKTQLFKHALRRLKGFSNLDLLIAKDS